MRGFLLLAACVFALACRASGDIVPTETGSAAASSSSPPRAQGLEQAVYAALKWADFYWTPGGPDLAMPTVGMSTSWATIARSGGTDLDVYLEMPPTWMFCFQDERWVCDVRSRGAGALALLRARRADGLAFQKLYIANAQRRLEVAPPSGAFRLVATDVLCQAAPELFRALPERESLHVGVGPAMPEYPLFYVSIEGTPYLAVLQWIPNPVRLRHCDLALVDGGTESHYGVWRNRILEAPVWVSMWRDGRCHADVETQ